MTSNDCLQYRLGYPGKEDDITLNDNYFFYCNQIPMRPEGVYIEEILEKWAGDYTKLEYTNNYINWLFPTRDKPKNLGGHPLQLHEAKAIKSDPQSKKRVFRAYVMMLDFYGIELTNQYTGELKRGNNWEEKAKSLNKNLKKKDKMERGRPGTSVRRPFWRGRGYSGRSNWRPYYQNRRCYRGRSYKRGISQAKHTTDNDGPLQSQTLEAGEILSQFSQPVARVVEFCPKDGPYNGWKLYLPDEHYDSQSNTVKKLQLVEEYCRNLQLSGKKEEIENRQSFTFDVKSLAEDVVIKEKWPDLITELKETPESVINYIGLALHHFLTKEIFNELSKEQDDSSVQFITDEFNVPKIHARLSGYEPLTQMKNLKANYYGKFVSVKGTVVRVSNVKPLCTKMAFECGNCSNVQVITQPYGKYTLPTRCAVRGCRSRTFIPLRSSPLTETVDWQSIRLQEIIIDDQREGGRVPRTIEAELMFDLVDICVPGDIVILSGVVKVTSTDEGGFKANRDKCMFLLYVLANCISSCKGKFISSLDTSMASVVGLEFNLKDLYAIQAIQAEDNLFRLLVASLCPTIYGHEMVKAGLVLGLVGGTQKYVDDFNHIPVRGDPHILVVGDPGLGKSQMLQACANVAPRGVYICGNTTTTSGLTVTLSKEGSSGEYALEAGALVLADQGCCCIDEFDKMPNQHYALLEAMEQQTISIAKAGIVCSLPARTSILAAANPVGGHYNKSKTVSENLKMGSPLLSRFDLVFILLDKPDEELDSKLSEHVMALHAGRAKEGGGKGTLKTTVSNCPTPVSVLNQLEYVIKQPLSERLKYTPNEECDPIPHQLLRKYFAYARKYVHPKLSSEACEILQKFYLELRKHHQTGESTPITTRQLESMIRLTEAHARIDLREECTRQDALDVVEIMKYSMVDTYSDEFGLLDFQRSQHGSGMSGRSHAKKFIAALTKVAEQTYNSLFTVSQMREIATDLGIHVSDFLSFVSSLNNQGFLLKKGPKVYQLQTTDY
ncbi:DNA helicase MCM8-like isoform X2 [Tachypleus tridentatus]